MDICELQITKGNDNLFFHCGSYNFGLALGIQIKNRELDSITKNTHKTKKYLKISQEKNVTNTLTLSWNI